MPRSPVMQSGPPDILQFSAYLQVVIYTRSTHAGISKQPLEIVHETKSDAQIGQLSDMERSIRALHFALGAHPVMF